MGPVYLNVKFYISQQHLAIWTRHPRPNCLSPKYGHKPDQCLYLPVRGMSVTCEFCEDWLKSTLSPVLYGDIVLSINTHTVHGCHIPDIVCARGQKCMIVTLD